MFDKPTELLKVILKIGYEILLIIAVITVTILFLMGKISIL